MANILSCIVQTTSLVVIGIQVVDSVLKDIRMEMCVVEGSVSSKLLYCLPTTLFMCSEVSFATMGYA